MPCTGPTMPTDDYVNKVTDELLDYLKQKKYISFDEPSKIQIPGSMFEHRQKSIELFRNGVREILIQDACESF